ncbi:unnamed protein product [Lota lota]
MVDLSLLLVLFVTTAHAQWWALIFGDLDDTSSSSYPSSTTSYPSSTTSSIFPRSTSTDPTPKVGTRVDFTSRGTTGDLITSQKFVGSSPTQGPTSAPYPAQLTTEPRSPSPGNTLVPARPNRTRPPHKPLKLWKSDRGSGRHLDLMELIGVPLPPGVSFTRGFDSLPAFSFSPDANIGRLARTFLPGPFYPDFTIIATVRPSSPRGGVLFAITDGRQQVVELGLVLSPAQQGLQSILLYYSPPQRYAHSYKAASFTVPEMTDQWSRFTVAVEGDEVRLYMDCGEAELTVFQRGGAPLSFSHDSGVFVGNAGGTGLHKFVDTPGTSAAQRRALSRLALSATSHRGNEVIEMTGWSSEKALKEGEEPQDPGRLSLPGTAHLLLPRGGSGESRTHGSAGPRGQRGHRTDPVEVRRDGQKGHKELRCSPVCRRGIRQRVWGYQGNQAFLPSWTAQITKCPLRSRRPGSGSEDLEDTELLRGPQILPGHLDHGPRGQTPNTGEGPWTSDPLDHLDPGGQRPGMCHLPYQELFFSHHVTDKTAARKEDAQRADKPAPRPARDRARQRQSERTPAPLFPSLYLPSISYPSPPFLTQPAF